MSKNIDPINQAVRDAKKAFNKAQFMQTHRREQVKQAAQYLEKIAEYGIKASDEDIDLLRRAATREGWNELGIDRVLELLDRIGKPISAVEEARWRGNLLRETTPKSEFSLEERRLILAALHPDNSASSERREAAFKAFSGKVERGKK
jgi:hypothetical protein